MVSGVDAHSAAASSAAVVFSRDPDDVFVQQASPSPHALPAFAADPFVPVADLGKDYLTRRNPRGARRHRAHHRLAIRALTPTLSPYLARRQVVPWVAGTLAYQSHRHCDPGHSRRAERVHQLYRKPAHPVHLRRQTHREVLPLSSATLNTACQHHPGLCGSTYYPLSLSRGSATLLDYPACHVLKDRVTHNLAERHGRVRLVPRDRRLAKHG